MTTTIDRNPATTWRGLSGPFDCTACGKSVIFDSGGPMQTLDGKRKECRDCVQARVNAHWDAQPPGIYGINFSDHTGKVLATSYVRHRC